MNNVTKTPQEKHAQGYAYSKCCDVRAVTAGGKSIGSTCWYVCTDCRKPCDILFRDINTTTMKKPIQISELLWEYEDQLPPMRSDDYETLYQYSKVIEGVRMYPFIEDAVGNKIWIAI